MNKTLNFREDRIFSYGRFNKISFGISLIISIFILFLLGLAYLFQRDSNFYILTLLNSVISHVSSQISRSTPLGIIYTTLFGGLFFVSIPLEVFFVRFLNSGHPMPVVFLLYFFGMVISFTADYYIGLKLSRLSKQIISPKKFYKTKGMLNRYGSLGIFLFNAFPLPANQLLIVVLGVFRYNKAKFYIFFLLGQLVKHIVIAIINSFF